MRLTVELHDTIIGHLEGETRTFDFSPNEHALAELGINSTALSVSIPLALPPAP